MTETGKLATDYENLQKAYADLQMQNAVLTNLLGAVIIYHSPEGTTTLGEGYYAGTYDVTTQAIEDAVGRPVIQLTVIEKD